MELRVSAYGVIVVRDRILLSHWSMNGYAGWTLPGGGIEPGEDPVDAAVREIFEETGHEASLDRLLGVNSLVLTTAERADLGTGDSHGIRIIYEATITGGELRAEVDGSTDDVRWFDLNEIDTIGAVSLVPAGLDLWRAAHTNGATRSSG